ncbi:MAG: leucine-rich repeat domain-containing protein [Treponema sp.]|nr:leucine-rich repeat domain-containing protein [Treponema sp.]
MNKNTILLLVLVLPVCFTACLRFNTQQYDKEADFEFRLLENGRAVEITGYVGSNETVRIPPRIMGVPVTSIGPYAFAGTGLTDVILPDSIISVGEGAFEHTNVILPGSSPSADDHTLTNIGLVNSAELPPAIDPLQHRGGTSPYADNIVTLRFFGWSRSGNAAFLIEDNGSSGMGPYEISRYVIMNAVTDAVVFSMEIETQIDPSTEGIDNIVIITINGNTIHGQVDLMSQFRAAMDTHEIIVSNAAFLPFPFAKDGYQYTSFVQTVRGNAHIIVSRNGRNKTISTTDFDENYDVFILGYFLSPFENRILAAYSSRFHHAHALMQLHLAGCHLGIGF